MLKEIADHPATQGAMDFLSSKYFTPPKWNERRDIPVVEDNIGILANYGIRLSGALGKDNVISINRGMGMRDLGINFNGSSGSRVLFGLGSPLLGSINIRSDKCLFSASGFLPNSTIKAEMNGGPVALIFGEGVSSVGTQWIVEGNGKSAIIGDDCMFSWDIVARNYDSHAIFDLESQEVINPASDILIGAHVWIGQRAAISRGVSIGSGAIVGLGSIVTKDIQPCSAVAGVPANVLRTGVTWDRGRAPSKEQMSKLVEHLSQTIPPTHAETRTAPVLRSVC